MNSPVHQSPGTNRQYHELMVKTNALMRDYSQLEEELTAKCLKIQDLQSTVSQLELALKQLYQNRDNDVCLYEKEITFYKETIADLQRKNTRLVNELDNRRVYSKSLTTESDDKYFKLLKSFKALQSDMELERNSKALLIDQIEYLSRERDFLLSHHSSPNNSNNSIAFAGHDNGNQNDPNDQINNETNGKHIHNDSYDSDDSSVHGTRLLSSLGEIDNMESNNIETSSPLKPPHLEDHLEHLQSGGVLDDDEELFMPQKFQFPPPSPSISTKQAFPPSPEPLVKSAKRKSLPAKLKSSPEVEDFVLSPLKLPNNHGSSYFDISTSAPSLSTHKRYSSSKPNHTRYNSHDLVPIKVEFELQDRLVRSLSAPDKAKEYLGKLTSVDEMMSSGTVDDQRDEAFMKLNGFASSPSKRDSLLTSSSKRSSLYTDFNVLSGDITKQEIMKLKFELQSLRLHNEKLLSYIGFELQKQKKNIKKLSSRNNLRALAVGNNNSNKGMEYSDAKLIEKLRNMLIQKKRVLRSVSVNPILSTKYGGGSGKRSLVESGLGLGIFPGNYVAEEDDEDFVFRSHFMNTLPQPEHTVDSDDCDDYGFLKHQKNHSGRLFSHKTLEYLNEAGSGKEKQPKKFKSQTFVPQQVSSSDEDIAGSEWEPIDGDSDSEASSGSSWELESCKSVEYSRLNTFNQLRYLVLGKEHFKKKPRNREEPLVDEHLKYKFLTIVIGIAIVGLRFTTSAPHHQLHH